MGNIHANNFVGIQSFMVKDLHLKGNELLVYAIIYGFSQTDGTSFSGGLQYLMDWTNSSKQGVINNLKSLIEKGLITKTVSQVGGVNIVDYRSTFLTEGVNFVDRKGQLCLPNNKDNKYIYSDVIKNIIDYLNKKANTHWRCNSKDTIKHIKARLDEGYTEEDFKKVIDRKCADWLGTEWQDYLRPMTLFGTKFESYLNAKGKRRRGANGVVLDEKADDDLDGIL
jgi:uncharacterized phage protein (TIGR02220 family)